MWREIYTHLKQNKIDVYPPAQHKGICKEPYIVLNKAGEIGVESHSTGIYDVMVYYPLGKYSTLENYRKNVINILSKLECLRKTGTETPVIYEDEIQAYSFSIQYILMKS